MTKQKGVRYKDLQVDVSFRDGRQSPFVHDVRHSFRLHGGLPQNLCVEGLILTVAEKQKENGNGNHVNPDHKVSRVARRKLSVEITLPEAQTADIPTWKKYSVLMVPREIRSFFPPYKQDFVLRTQRGDFIVRIASAHDVEKDKYRGGYISGASKFFAAHDYLAPGDKLVFKKDGEAEIEGKKYPVYKVTCPNSS